MRFGRRKPNGDSSMQGYIDAPRKSHYRCQIRLLDDTQISHDFPKRSKAQVVLDHVFWELDLDEREYFGLTYQDEDDERQWLNPLKTLKKQLKRPFCLEFAVRFYVPDPAKIREELTRYLFFQQLKRDLASGKLDPPFRIAAELFALAIQSELGDYDPNTHDRGYVSEFRFLPTQTESLEEEIAELHKALKGQTPATAEATFLHRAKWLDLYGVDFHEVVGVDKVAVKLGLTPNGVIVLQGKTKVASFLWPRIRDVAFKRRKFYVRTSGKETGDRDATLTFVLHSSRACKRLWKCALDHHTFFRLLEPPVEPKHSKLSFFRRTSKHRFSGRTQWQADKDAAKKLRREPKFQRTPSRRYMRRSFCGADGLRVDGAGADNPMFARATSLRSHHAVRNNIDPSRWTHRKTSAPSSSGRIQLPSAVSSSVQSPTASGSSVPSAWDRQSSRFRQPSQTSSCQSSISSSAASSQPSSRTGSELALAANDNRQTSPQPPSAETAIAQVSGAIVTAMTEMRDRAMTSPDSMEGSQRARQRIRERSAFSQYSRSQTAGASGGSAPVSQYHSPSATPGRITPVIAPTRPVAAGPGLPTDDEPPPAYYPPRENSAATPPPPPFMPPPLPPSSSRSSARREDRRETPPGSAAVVASRSDASLPRRFQLAVVDESGRGSPRGVGVVASRSDATLPQRLQVDSEEAEEGVVAVMTSRSDASLPRRLRHVILDERRTPDRKRSAPSSLSSRKDSRPRTPQDDPTKNRRGTPVGRSFDGIEDHLVFSPSPLAERRALPAMPHQDDVARSKNVIAKTEDRRGDLVVTQDDRLGNRAECDDERIEAEAATETAEATPLSNEKDEEKDDEVVVATTGATGKPVSSAEDIGMARDKRSPVSAPPPPLPENRAESTPTPPPPPTPQPVFLPPPPPSPARNRLKILNQPLPPPPLSPQSLLPPPSSSGSSSVIRLSPLPRLQTRSAYDDMDELLPPPPFLALSRSTEALLEDIEADSESSTPLRGRSIEPLPPPPPDLEFSTPTRSISGLRFASGTNSLNSSQYSLPPFPDNYGQDLPDDWSDGSFPPPPSSHRSSLRSSPLVMEGSPKRARIRPTSAGNRSNSLNRPSPPACLPPPPPTSGPPPPPPGEVARLMTRVRKSMTSRSDGGGGDERVALLNDDGDERRPPPPPPNDDGLVLTNRYSGDESQSPRRSIGSRSPRRSVPATQSPMSERGSASRHNNFFSHDLGSPRRVGVPRSPMSDRPYPSYPPPPPPPPPPSNRHETSFHASGYSSDRQDEYAFQRYQRDHADHVDLLARVRNSLPIRRTGSTGAASYSSETRPHHYESSDDGRYSPKGYHSDSQPPKFAYGKKERERLMKEVDRFSNRVRTSYSGRSGATSDLPTPSRYGSASMTRATPPSPGNRYNVGPSPSSSLAVARSSSCDVVPQSNRYGSGGGGGSRSSRSARPPPSSSSSSRSTNAYNPSFSPTTGTGVGLPSPMRLKTTTLSMGTLSSDL
ncbi:uncharacterized protein [Oscarella lobularis]|uniref:uncharacterized protein isoform X2 n=1 Tax=Oscarella lobularis TaxID=121494 RepID=UPI0033139893